MIRSLLLVISLLGYFIARAQPCDSVFAHKASYYQKQYKKYNRKVRAEKKLSSKKTELVFEIAGYLRQQKDTSYKAWYLFYIDAYKKNLQGCIKKADRKRAFLYKLAVSYFYLEKYEEAVTFFSKCIAAKYNSPCVRAYLAESERKIRR